MIRTFMPTLSALVTMAQTVNPGMILIGSKQGHPFEEQTECAISFASDSVSDPRVKRLNIIGCLLQASRHCLRKLNLQSLFPRECPMQSNDSFHSAGIQGRFGPLA